MVLEYVNGGELFEKIVRVLSPYHASKLMKQTLPHAILTVIYA
jgi:hypothetical protein